MTIKRSSDSLSIHGGANNTMHKNPKTEANNISKALRLVLGGECIPVDIQGLVVEWSNNVCPEEPILGVKSVPLPNFEGMLVKSPRGNGWMIGVNDQMESEGRIRFTIAHEFGHYILHRDVQEKFECSNQDMHSWGSQVRAMEAEADTFASYLLMPLDDFRRQIEGQKLSFDLLRHCADRYGVSLTAAALKWREIAPGRAIVLSAKDGFLDWSCSNKRAFQTGAYFATKNSSIEVPAGSLLLDATRSATGHFRRIPASTWFPKESSDVFIEEHAFVVEGGDFSYVLGVLLLPEIDVRLNEDEDVALEPLTGRPTFI